MGLERRGATVGHALVADDDQVARRVLKELVESIGFEVSEASDGIEAIKGAREETAIALLDLNMPRASGLDCLRAIKEKSPDAEVLMVSGAGEIKYVVEAMRRGAYWYFEKPINGPEVTQIIRRALEHRELSRQHAELMSAVSSQTEGISLQGSSLFFRDFMTQIDRVAPLDSTVLLTGESGTGKSTIARYMHQRSARARGPFVALNCAALPRDLLEAELFGYEKGAFTGAINSRPGKIELADGGTLFLDEIGDLPLELQPKLLTFLQDRTVQRLGSHETRELDVRIITATLQDLESMCKQRQFREDLYFRLNVICMYVPPLREHIDDLPDLVQGILSRLAGRRGSARIPISRQALDSLLQYHWPGNIRELENILERASVFCGTDGIKVEDLNFEQGQRNVNSTVKGTPPIGTQTITEPLGGLSLEQIERMAIIETLKKCKGNKAAAARMLQISEKSIYNKIKRLGIKECGSSYS